MVLGGDGERRSMIGDEGHGKNCDKRIKFKGMGLRVTQEPHSLCSFGLGLA